MYEFAQSKSILDVARVTENFELNGCLSFKVYTTVNCFDYTSDLLKKFTKTKVLLVSQNDKEFFKELVI